MKELLRNEKVETQNQTDVVFFIYEAHQNSLNFSKELITSCFCTKLQVLWSNAPNATVR